MLQTLAQISDSGRIALLLARHGRTRHNAERRIVGRMDVPLDDTGMAQAGAFGRAYAPLRRAGLYSSPLKRAFQTASALGSPTPIVGLQELDQGDWEGELGVDMMRQHPQIFAAWAQDPSDVRIPGGETLRECQTRSLQALARVVQRHSPGDTVVVVAHQMVLASTILHMQGRPLREVRAMHQGNTATNALSWHPDDGWQVHRVNDRTHLPE
jgi:broad specificity phosphatase PhoE